VPEIHGHRGARALRPENTLPGLAYALTLGVDAIEFDVTLTADGGLILAHDLVVEAKTILDTGPAVADDPLYPYVGKPWRSLTLEQIATLDAGDRRPPEPFQDTFAAIPGTPVPTLAEVCALVGDDEATPVTLAVELKTNPSWPDADVTGLTQAVLATLARYGLTGRSRILGFDWRVLRAAAGLAPEVPRVALLEPRTWVPGSAWLAGLDPADYGAASGTSGATAGEPDGVLGSAAAARDIGAAWLSPWDFTVSPDLVAAAHSAGLRVVVWTVNDPERMATLINMDVDAIVTDRPDLLGQLLAGG
jgi:glycerophosphoryl diester phosphodiesterase